MSKDYGYFGSGDSGYHQYMTSFDRTFGGSGSTGDSSDFGNNGDDNIVVNPTKMSSTQNNNLKPELDDSKVNPFKASFWRWVKENKEDPGTWLSVLFLVGTPALVILCIIFCLIVKAVRGF